MNYANTFQNNTIQIKRFVEYVPVFMRPSWQRCSQVCLAQFHFFNLNIDPLAEKKKTCHFSWQVSKFYTVLVLNKFFL